MVSALDSGASGPGSSPDRGHCFVFWTIVGETSQNCGEVTCDGLAARPGEVKIVLAASCNRNRDKLRQLLANLGSKASLHFIRKEIVVQN